MMSEKGQYHCYKAVRKTSGILLTGPGVRLDRQVSLDQAATEG